MIGLGIPEGTTRSRQHVLLRRAGWAAGWFILGALLITLGYQLPARYHVTVGQNDGGYVQGFHDAANRWGGTSDPAAGPPSTDSPFRWSRAESFLLFPHPGAPAELALRWRAPVEPYPAVEVWLNGTMLLGRIQASGKWETHTFSIPAQGTVVSSKPDDLFVALRTIPPVQVDGTSRGVQVDRAVLTAIGFPHLPAPGQVFQGGLALLLAAVLLRQRRTILLTACLGALAWLLLYRFAITGYPVRHLLRWSLIGLSGALLVRHGPRLARQLQVGHVRLVALALTTAWLLAVLVAGQQHLVLSAPGVEKDFRVFATRSTQLLCPPDTALPDGPCVLRADGFYQLGYPFLLWLFRPLTQDNAFLAARLVAALSAGALLLGTYLLGVGLVGAWAALLALGIVGLNAFTWQYALLLGTDMPFAAAWTLAFAAIVTLGSTPSRRRLVGVGALCGVTFLLRHPGILLLPLAALATVLTPPRLPNLMLVKRWVWLLAGFTLAASPQLVLNTLHTAQPFYSQQAKNIWLAVYGNTDWSRWNEASNDVGLLELVRHEPSRFWRNWTGNVVAFLGSGAEDPSEFGRSWGLRLLGFPANLLALAGLVGWAWRGNARTRFVVGAALLYVVAISVGFVLPRFFLPLVGIWAVAAAGALCRLPGGTPVVEGRPDSPRRRIVLALIVIVLLGQGPGSATRAVLGLEDSDAAAMARIISATLAPGATIEPRLAADETLAKYSAVAHRFVANERADYVLWSSRSGKEQPAGTLQSRSGPYYLYHKGLR